MALSMKKFTKLNYMDKGYLVAILVFISITGIINLYFIRDMLIYNLVSIEDVLHHKGEMIRVQGTISNIYTAKGGHKIMTLTDSEESIKAVIFAGSVDIPLNTLKKGQEVNVIGKVDEYKDELEIIVGELG